MGDAVTERPSTAAVRRQIAEARAECDALRAALDDEWVADVMDELNRQREEGHAYSDRVQYLKGKMLAVVSGAEARAECDALRAALEQAADDLESVWNRCAEVPHDAPMAAFHTPEGVAQTAYFGLERVRAALAGSADE